MLFLFDSIHKDWREKNRNQIAFFILLTYERHNDDILVYLFPNQLNLVQLTYIKLNQINDLFESYYHPNDI